MGRPSREPASPSALAPALLRFARARGLDAELLACRFGLAPDGETKDEVPIPAAASGALMAAVAEALGEPFLALRLPAELPHRQYGLAELAARASADVRGALERLALYAPLIHPQIACELSTEGEEARWTQRTPAHPRGLGRHVHEYGLAYVLTHLRAGAGAELGAPARVWFAHARPPDLAPLHAYFGTRDLSFGAPESGFSLAARALDLPMRDGDARLAATAYALADAAMRAQPRDRATGQLVAARLEALLPTDPTIDGVARVLHMSARTLQRRLEEEGTSFSEVLDGVRRDLSRRLLGDPSLSLAEIAYRAGFADLATFSRAFKRWTGKPPGAWRRS